MKKGGSLMDIRETEKSSMVLSEAEFVTNEGDNACGGGSNACN